MALGTRTSHLDPLKVDWHNQALWSFREKRDAAMKLVPEWEELRTLASQIKDHTLSQLDEYLIKFERKASTNGVLVHWAKDAEQHNRIVTSILEKHSVRRIVKSKSMLTEECGLNEHLESLNYEVIDTDLGERIIQLKEEAPSHIVAPAIHLKKEEIGELFHNKLHTEKGNFDPGYLTEAARKDLRRRFLEAEAAITGVNFAVAESGSVVVVTNEGNADMGVHSAPVQIHCMGIEKMIPKVEHLAVFIRLLARSSTGQPISIYTSHHQSPKKGGEMHVVIVDNGRSDLLGRREFRNGLKCIRCGACINTCPVYRRSGGHSYEATIPGPIGSILNPAKDMLEYGDLPFASSLCGSCSDVCPVKIDIHQQLYMWRQKIEEQRKKNFIWVFIINQMVRTLSDPERFARHFKIMRMMLRNLPDFLFKNRWNAWSRGRDLPEPPKESFREWMERVESRESRV